jgi:hypothetical protein
MNIKRLSLQALILTMLELGLKTKKKLGLLTRRSSQENWISGTAAAGEKEEIFDLPRAAELLGLGKVRYCCNYLPDCWGCCLLLETKGCWLSAGWILVGPVTLAAI